VIPSCARSPAARTAGVASSAPVGGPFLRAAGCGGEVGRADFARSGLGTIGLVPAGFRRGALVPVAAPPAAALAGFARSRPTRAGRVEGRLPSTLFCAGFLVVFLAVLSGIRSGVGQIRPRFAPPTGYSHRSKRQFRLVDFKKYSS
jgi:hypothetical protein